ncbi:carbamoyltransferase [Plantactinospora sp. KLBMP9567]|uniref:carbamoyltransferase family protein n=1 Tax=Plantactinospora sp. KLBMP9567 TaxID=3085900 RepID=UPI002981821F|nr:carbamoyltransferase N-terminal domain-containing protein [Plantactinospora sp. KLBMP9567]MDW5324864.1 carbamoyltransferase N-terminal domain-containing protein [Plantactinospora sp. KLBMP9567]
MIVVGVSAFYHDSAVAVVQDGRLVAAAQEERFTRRRYDRDVPLYAYRSCLDEAGIGPADVDCLAYYENPVRKLSRQLWMELPGMGAGDGPAHVLDASHPERQIRERLGYDGRFLAVEHHEAHAASAFYCSGYREAALFTADAVGEWTTTSYGAGDDDGIRLLEDVPFPHSLGLLYSALTSYLGFSVNSDEYKVMGLASYGRPRYRSALDQVVSSGPGGQFRLDTRYLAPQAGGRLYTPELAELLGVPPRAPGGDLTPAHRDLASSVQSLLEELLLEKLDHLYQLRPSDNLCYAGGVALNCVANTRLRRRAKFRDWFVPPAPGDAGSAAGAALLVHHRLTGTRRLARLTDARLGPAHRGTVLAEVLTAAGVEYQDFTGREPELLDRVAELLAGGAIVGWHQGRMEFGPRALGGRSILADPRDPGMRDRINRLVKKREEFRPFAPAVVAERAADFFDLDVPSPFMLETVAVRAGTALPAITHVDGSARVQTVDRHVDPRFHRLLIRFGELTGTPLLLNTSFNVAGEPIVCDEVDALSCFVRAGVDALAVGDLLVRREAVPPVWSRHLSRSAGPRRVDTHNDSYTFFV